MKFAIHPFRAVSISILSMVGLLAPLSHAGTERSPVVIVKERGPHHRVEEWIEPFVDNGGLTNFLTHAYTVLGGGMNYYENGEWKPTIAEFEPVVGGWLAAKGAHQVFVSEELYVAGAITVVAPGGALWRSTPMSLAIRDRTQGRVLVLGECHETRGKLVSPDTVIFQDAFDGPVRADVRVVYRTDGIECDVIVRNQLPDSDELGIIPEESEIIVLTELFEGGPTAVSEYPRGFQSGPQGDTTQNVNSEVRTRSDAVLQLGELVIDNGKAFGIDPASTITSDPAVPVFKQFYQDQPTQRVFLEEATPLGSLAPLLNELPGAKIPGAHELRWRNTAGSSSGGIPGVASVPLPKPANLRAPVLARTADGRFDTASIGSSRDDSHHKSVEIAASTVPFVPTRLAGVVLDWTAVTTVANQNFKCNTTYYVSAPATLTGTVQFEGGTVIKFASTGTPELIIDATATIKWYGEPYRPVIFTSKDDTSVGDSISGSTGNPGTGSYATRALVLNGTGRTTPLILANLQIRNAAIGVEAAYFAETAPLILRHIQLINCNSAFKLQNGATPNAFQLQNSLVVGGSTLFQSVINAKVSAEFLTADGVANLKQGDSGSTFNLANCVFVGVAGAASDVPNGVYVASPGTGVFTTAGAASHYIPTSSAASGTATRPLPSTWTVSNGVDSEVTLTPPTTLGAITTATTLSRTPPPGADRNRAGYHYWHIDQIVNAVDVSAALTIPEKLVLSVNNSPYANTSTPRYGFKLGTGGSINVKGSAMAPVRIVRAAMVHEGLTGYNTATGGALSFEVIKVDATGSATGRNINATFTYTSFPADTAARRYWLDLSATGLFASLNVSHSQFLNATITLGPTSSPVTQSANIRNNLFEGGGCFFYHYYDHSMVIVFRNNLVRHGACWVSYYQQTYLNPYFYIEDNLFDTGDLANSGSYTIAAGNGYRGSSQVFGGSANMTNLSLDDPALGWQAGPIGRFYYPVASSTGSGLGRLVNTATQTLLASGLHHFTTQINQSKEGGTALDIGFHYVAVDGDLRPKDSDGDGLADYLEDTDADGNPDDLTQLNNPDTDNDGLSDGADPNPTVAGAPPLMNTLSPIKCPLP